MDFGDAQFQEDWQDLAETGKAVLEEIFDQCSLEDLKKCLGRNAVTPDSPPISVRIETEAFFLPWEMLAWPENSPNEPLDCRIWGFLYDITRSVIDAEMKITKPRLMVDTLPDMLFFSLEDKDPQVATMNQFKQDNQVNLTPVLPFTNRSEQEQRKREVDDNLVEYLKRPLHIVHFGCHAEGAESEENAKFQVNQTFYLSLYDFIERNCTFIGNPLVFLNACETGIFRGKAARSTSEDNPLAPKVAADFVRVFLRDLGACGVLATEYKIPSDFAAEFAKEFYSLFLKRELSAGEALLQSRQEFIRNRRNPLGLFFSAYLEPETRIFLNQSSIRRNLMKTMRTPFSTADGNTKVQELASAFKNPPEYILVFPLHGNATFSILHFAALQSATPDTTLMNHPKLHPLARSQIMDAKMEQEKIAPILENYGIIILTERGAPVQVLVAEVLGEEYRPPVTMNDTQEASGICPHCEKSAYRLVTRIKGKFIYYCSECAEQWK